MRCGPGKIRNSWLARVYGFTNRNGRGNYLVRIERRWAYSLFLGFVILAGLAIGAGPWPIDSSAEAVSDEDRIDAVELLDAALAEDPSSAAGASTGTAEQLASASAAYGAGDRGPCFIATAAYGTPLASEIDVLRDMRDAHMLTNLPGTVLADTYYRSSPALAQTIAHHPQGAALVRALLRPLIVAAGHPALAALAILFAAAAALRMRKLRRAH